MRWNVHSNLEGKHAFLSASKYHWINYDEEKLANTYVTWRAAQKGTELHDLASKLITLGVALPRKKETINLYVNDAIKFKMKPEQLLYFSENCFGTADAIGFDGRILRIHDLKTGKSPTSMNQLKIYVALFCFEYDIDPKTISIELRIYQLDQVFYYEPEVEEIYFIMEKMIAFDKCIDQLKQGE